MTKDDLPPHWWLLNRAHGLSPQQYAEEYARAAIAAHDAKREKVFLRRVGGPESKRWVSQDSNSRHRDCEYRWAYIEREGA